jgi:hypothetical protein
MSFRSGASALFADAERGIPTARESLRLDRRAWKLIGFLAALEMTRKRKKEQLNPQLLHFLVVILAIENVPLLSTFRDDALLAFDFLAG